MNRGNTYEGNNIIFYAFTNRVLQLCGARE
jgi:hypothetical protein